MRNPEDPAWPDHGERTSDPEIADQWKWAYLAQMRGEHRRRVFRLGRQPRPIGPAVEGFLAHRSAVVGRSTWSGDRTGTAHLLQHFGPGAYTSALTAPALQELVDDRLRTGYEPSTLATYLKVWRVFLEWCHFGVCGKALRDNATYRAQLAHYPDPVDGVTLPNPGKGDVDTFSDAEIVRILEAARAVDAQQTGHFPSAVLACGIGLYMGLRQGEVFAATWQGIRVSSKTIRVEYQVPKDSIELVPLKGKVARTALILPGWWDLHRSDAVGFIVGRTGRPVGTRTQRNLITRVLDTAGLNDVGRGWHILRHTFARMFVEMGGRLEELQKSLGHQSIVTTQERYGHFHEDVAARLAMERIYRA